MTSPKFVADDELDCYPRPSAGRALIGRHVVGCEDARCRGCQRCTRFHCTVCREQHADRVCTPCLHDTREDLHAIAELYVMARLHTTSGSSLDAAGVSGRLVSAQDIPGGTAAVLTGPAARDDILTERHVYRRNRAGDPFTEDDELDSDPEPVAYTLATWELWYRTSMALAPPPLKPRVGRAMRFLDQHLTDFIGVDNPRFADFAADLRNQRRRIEDELRAGDRAAVGAVDCERCGLAYVRHFLRPRPGSCFCPPWIPARHSQDVPHDVIRLSTYLDNVVCIRCHWDSFHAQACQDDQGGRPDDWECPKCGDSLTDGQYKQLVAQDYRDHAEYLPAQLIEERTGIRAGRIRLWAHRGHIRREGKDAEGRTLFWVAQVLGVQSHLEHRCECPVVHHASHVRDDLCCWACHLFQTCRAIPRKRGLRSVVAS